MPSSRRGRSITFILSFRGTPGFQSDSALFLDSPDNMSPLIQGIKISTSSNKSDSAKVVNEVKSNPIAWVASQPRCEPRSLAFAYTEYLRSALRAKTLNRRTLVLHGDLLRTLDLNLRLALHAISLCHCLQPPLTKISAEAITYMSVRQYIGVRDGSRMLSTSSLSCLSSERFLTISDQTMALNLQPKRYAAG